jgi:hypothetical protein
MIPEKAQRVLSVTDNGEATITFAKEAAHQTLLH